MKMILILSLLFCAIVLPALGELTDADFDKIRLIVKEEVKTEIAASEKRLMEHIDLKIETVNARIDATNARIDGVEKSLSARIDAVEEKLSARIDATNTRIDSVDTNLNRVWLMIIALIGLITATIAIPQIIVAYRDRGRRELQAEIQHLRERLEALEDTPS